MKNADLFKQIFNIYATELWSMPEKEFLEWLNKNAVPAIPISVIEQIKADIADLNKYKFPGCGESLYYNAAEVDFIIYSILKECKE